MSVVFESFSPVFIDAVSIAGRRGRSVISDAAGDSVATHGRRGHLAAMVSSPVAPDAVSVFGRRGRTLVSDAAHDAPSVAGGRGRVYVSEFSAPPICVVQGYGRRGSVSALSSYVQNDAVSCAGRRGTLYAGDAAGDWPVLRGRRGMAGVSDIPVLSQSSIVLLQTAGYLYAMGDPGMSPSGTPMLFFIDTVSATTPTLTVSLGLAFGDIVRIATSADAKGVRLQQYGDSVALSAVYAIVNQIVIADGIALSDMSAATLNKLLALADLLVVEDNSMTLRHAIMTVAATVWLADALRSGAALQFGDDLALAASQSVQVRHLVSALEALNVADTMTPRLGAMMIARDSMNLVDVITAARAARMGLLDRVLIGGVFRFAGIDYQIYAMTTVGAAVSEYDGWKYNSFMTIGGVTYGVDDTGIAVLTGNTDDGSPIDASVRMGLSSLGTSLYKRVPNVYIGYSSATGQMLMRVTTTSGAGSPKAVYYYKLNATPRESYDNARFDIGKGLMSAYWDFEIGNIVGEDFELDFVEVWRVALSRRKT